MDRTHRERRDILMVEWTQETQIIARPGYSDLDLLRISHRFIDGDSIGGKSVPNTRQ